jgi:pilus assembly protein FimV
MPLNSWALGLGDIESNSFLNQPLNAEIALSATEEELATLRVSLAPVDAFLQQGLEYPAFLNSVEFNITQNAAGDNVIVVTSNRAIAEPFVTFLVEASHARGAITREYSVLLDPPLFLPPAADAPQIAAPVALEPARDVAGGPIERAPEPVAVQPPVVEPAVTAEIPSRPEPVAAAAETGTDYTVQGGDTLWDIASSVRPGGVTMNQAMLSIYDANPSAFDGNINRLRRGAILRIPPSSELGSLTAASATAEVQRQIDIWRNEVEATPQLVLLPPSEDALAGAAAAGGADTAAVSALEGQVSNLEVELAAAEAELAETRRLLELRSEELADLQVQLGDGPATEIAPETAVSDAALADDPLAGLESEPLFVDDLESEAAVAGVDEAPEAQVADSAAGEAAPGETATTSSAPVVFAESEPSLIERILGFLAQPIVLIAGGVIAVVLAALAFLRRRRDGGADDVTGQWQALESEMEEEFDHSATTQPNQLDEESNMVVVEGEDESLVDTDTDFGATAAIEAIGSDLDEDDASIPGTGLIESLTDESFEDETELLDIVEPAAEADAEPEPELADQTMSSQTIINLDQADPIAEADFHMAYGLYDQAADLISRALEAEPGDRGLKLKLLEVYFVWGNKDEFLATATGLREEIGEVGNSDWDKVVIMGKQICPDETLFSEATTGSPEIDLTLEASGVTEGLDFAFGEEGEGTELDLDILEDDEAVPAETSFADAETAGDQVAEESGEFLDIGERTQAGLKAAFFEDIADDESLAPEVDDVDIEGAIGDAESDDTALEVELEDIEVTQETPAFEVESDDYADSPTLEAPGMDSPTVETPAMDEATLETPAFDPEALEDFEEAEAAEIDEALAVEAEAKAEAKAVASSEVSSVRLAAAGGGTDMTAEIEIDDLGLDVGDVGEFDDLEISSDGGDEAFSDLMLDQPEADDAEQLSATGITKVLDQPDDEIDGPAADIGDDDATVMSPGFDIEATGSSTEVLEQPAGDFDPDQPAADEDLNFDDFSSALEGADTVERPAAYGFGGAGSLGASGANGSPSEQTGTTEIGPIDPQAMSEVGTKLDLARAYIDMGDPEGARSILDEVLNEGNDSQKSEAQSLLDSL